MVIRKKLKVFGFVAEEEDWQNKKKKLQGFNINITLSYRFIYREGQNAIYLMEIDIIV